MMSRLNSKLPLPKISHVSFKPKLGIYGSKNADSNTPKPMPAKIRAEAVFLAATGIWRNAHEGANTINHAPVMPATMRHHTYQAIGRWGGGTSEQAGAAK